VVRAVVGRRGVARAGGRQAAVGVVVHRAVRVEVASAVEVRRAGAGRDGALGEVRGAALLLRVGAAGVAVGRGATVCGGVRC
jgi:hypothetical protein